jgi:DNA-binding NarL/FixJ family response regulator
VIPPAARASGRDGAVRVLIVDDHRTVAEALQLAVESRADIECIGVAGTVEDALHQLAQAPCDVVLMDVSLPGTNGIEGTRQIRNAHPDTRVVVITGHLEPGILAAAVESGAAGFLPKDGPLGDVIDAILAPADAQLMVGTGTPVGVVAEAMRLREQAAQGTGPLSLLTPREVEVLGLLGEGFTPAAVAEQLGISLHTCRGHVKSVLSKLEVHSLLEAVVVGWQRGLIHRPGSY